MDLQITGALSDGLKRTFPRREGDRSHRDSMALEGQEQAALAIEHEPVSIARYGDEYS